MKKLGAILLAVALVVTLGATGVFAAVSDTEDGDTCGPTIPVGRVYLIDNSEAKIDANPVIIPDPTGLDLRLHYYESDTEIRVFNEQQNVSVTNLAYDGGTYTGDVDSHIIHQEPTLGTPGQVTPTPYTDAMRGRGCIEFATDIIGIIISDSDLDASDSVVGLATVTYPTGLALRGLEMGSGRNYQDLVEVDGNIIKVDLQSVEVMDQIRVLTLPSEEGKCGDLIAGQHIDVGDVIVSNDESYLYVQYVIDDPWVMTESHLHVAETELISTDPDVWDTSGVPQKNGNPPPGQFDYSDPHGPVTDYTYTIDLGDWGPCTDLLIAAHAVVVQKIDDCMNVVSDASVEWSADGTSWNPAVACWVHPSWNDVAGATWVWRTEYTDVVWEYDNVPAGGWYFQKTFTVPGNPVSGTIDINADNAYTLSLNSSPVGGEGAMNKDGPDNHEWATIDTFDLTNVNSGPNTIEVRALNFFNWGSSTSNPAGLAFNAEICYEDIIAEETAWGYCEPNGGEFPGANWATYLTYHVQ